MKTLNGIFFTIVDQKRHFFKVGTYVVGIVQTAIKKVSFETFALAIVHISKW